MSASDREAQPQPRKRRPYHNCKQHLPGCPVHQHPETPTACTCPVYAHPLCIFKYCSTPEQCRVPGVGCLNQQDRSAAFKGIEDKYFANDGACSPQPQKCSAACAVGDGHICSPQPSDEAVRPRLLGEDDVDAMQRQAERFAKSVGLAGGDKDLASNAFVQGWKARREYGEGGKP